MFANLKDSGYGIFEIPTMVLKKVRHLLSYPICLLINESLGMGRFPDSLKHASVTHVHMADNPLLVSNYRLMSVLHWLNKLFEKAIATRLTGFAIKNSLLSVNQFVFLSRMSTVDAITQLTEFIDDSTNRKSDTLCLFLDLKNAFETVDHQILLKKMKLYGVRGLPNLLIGNYLTTRMQR